MEIKHRFNDQVEAQVASIIESEYTTGQTNNQRDLQDFDSAVDMLECERTEKNYDWMSDIFLPEFPSHILTDASIMAAQYFQSRDFVDVYLEEDGTEETKAKCRAAKRCINATLNNPKIYHYQKYMRSRLTNALGGMVWLKCWWDKDVRPQILGYNTVEVPLDVDVYGNQIVSPMQQPAMGMQQEPVLGKRIITDRFNYDVVHPRDIFFAPNYCYSAQEKDWIIVRSWMLYAQLKKQEKANGYINLDVLAGVKPPEITGTEKLNEEGKHNPVKTPLKPFEILERFGPFWCKVNETDEDGFPTDVEPGYDEQGEILPDAQLIETIITFAVSDSTKTLIRFQPQFCRTKGGLTYRPIVRGLCYIHPTKDTGLSDGKYMRELQIGINDTFNMSQDRVKLATLPVFKRNKYAFEEGLPIIIEPEGTIDCENPAADLIELQIKDNMVGAINQIGMLKSQTDQVTSIYPTTMGELPAQASTTATAIAGAESRTNTRANYKSLTVEYTMLCELYWMIQQMTWQFAEKETAIKMMGPDVLAFDPEGEFTYIPLSQNIEMEHNKYRKLQMLQQLIGMVVNTQNPKTAVLLNQLLIMSFELMGKEFSDFKDALLDERAPVLPQGNAPANEAISPTSNQNALPMTPMEMAARERMNGPGGGVGMRGI